MGIYSNLAVQSVRKNDCGLIETALMLAEAEQTMFDALIELDFREAYCDKGVALLSEADNDQVKESKIKKMWEGFLAMLKKAKDTIAEVISKFIVKIQELVGADKRLVAKYGIISKDSVKDVEDIIEVPTAAAITMMTTPMANSAVDDVVDAINKIKDTNNIDELNAKVQELDSDLDKNIQEVKNSKTVEKKDTDASMFKRVACKDADAEGISKIMQDGFKDVIPNLKKDKDAALKKLDDVKKSAETELKQAKKDKDDLSIAKLNAVIRLCAKGMRATTMMVSFRVALVKKVITCTRSAYVALGSKANKSVKENAELGVFDCLYEVADFAVDRIFES